MPCQSAIVKTASKPNSYLPILISFLLIIISINASDHNRKTTNIGAIIDVNSRSGQEQKAAMEIAVENFNSGSMNQKFSLILQNSGREPLQAAYAAEELIKEKQAQVIIGMETWKEAALVASVGNQAKVPILSFASAFTKPPLPQIRWPFLVQMATKSSEQVDCIAAILKSYDWKKVIAIYEDDMYGGDSGMLNLLSEALKRIGIEIEYSLALAPVSSHSDPEGYVLREMVKLLRQQTRVFIVLQSSFSLVNHLFREAKELGLMGRDSVWIVSETISSIIDSIDTSIIALGIKSYYPKDSEAFQNFTIKFEKSFGLNHSKEDQDHSNPGIYALRAYDSISTISHAMKGLENEKSTSKTFLKNILSSNFTGLSGDIHFQNGSLSPSPTFRIINIVGRKYEELGYWSSKIGFRKSPNRRDGIVGNASMKVLDDSVNWPGNLKSVPKGWAMPSDEKPMKIGVPRTTFLEKFVKEESDGTPNGKKYVGFSIAVFDEVRRIVERDYYPLPYDFVPQDGNYGDMLNLVINKTLDAVVGDITILAERAEQLEFTQPYSESGLRMIVPVKSQPHKAWLFLKPFTKEMWLVTFAILIYTMVVVWLLEHQVNPEFRGSFKDQLGTALWFTFSTLFFVHTEKLRSNITRVVVVMWLFVVMIITSSYQASLTSMLTVPRLEPTVTNIGRLLQNNATVGCDGESFVVTYLNSVLKFGTENIKLISYQDDYPNEFKSGNITAAFLELPYQRLFLNQHCNQYTATGPTYRNGGLGFVFQKGSPIAADFSKAILMLLEDGKLKTLENEWLGSSSNCSDAEITNTDSLTLQSFQALYVISVIISALCFLTFLIRFTSDRRRQQREEYTGDKTPEDKRISNMRLKSPVRALNIGQRRGGDERRPSKWEYLRTHVTPQHFQSSPQTEIEMPIIST